MKTYFKILKLFVSVLTVCYCTLFTVNAQAQGWCDTQDMTCRQRNDEVLRQQREQEGRNGSDNSNSGGNSTPIVLPPRVSQFGAVAENSKTGTMGKSSMQSSARAAKRAALAQCGERGCKVLSAYANSCIAYAFGSSGHGFLRGQATLESASEKALSDCRAGDNNCQLFIAECSLP